MKFVKVVFSQVSVCPQGGLPHCMLGYTPVGRYIPWAVTPPHWAGTPLPWAGTCPPGQVHPLGQTSPCPVHAEIHTPPPHPVHAGIPPPSVQCMLGYGQQVGGTHPTGMHSCNHAAFGFCPDYEENVNSTE